MRAPAPSAGEAVARACPAQLTDLANRLTGAEKALEAHLTAAERFDRASAAPALESRLEAELQPLFADAPQGWSHETHMVDIEMADESAASGLDVLGEILARFHGSGAIARCEAEHPAVGHWSVRLTLAAAHPTVQVAAGGSLAIEPVGSCLGAALNQAIAATPVPQSFIGGVRFDTVNLAGP